VISISVDRQFRNRILRDVSVAFTKSEISESVAQGLLANLVEIREAPLSEENITYPELPLNGH